MTDYLDAAVDELVPGFADEQGDWEAVVRDAAARRAAEAGEARRPGVASGDTRRRAGRRRLVLAAILVAAIAVPLAAVGASENWWFFRFGGAPTPVTDVTVVKAGTWSGHDWQLLAYVSYTDGICFGITPAGSEADGQAAGMSCAGIEGVPRTAKSKPHARHGITYMSSSSERFPTYIVGPVIDTATEVAIHLADGTVVRTPTFGAPDELGAIRFYATEMPDGPQATEFRPRTQVRKLVGLDPDGEVVACLTTPTSEEVVALDACR